MKRKAFARGKSTVAMLALNTRYTAAFFDFGRKREVFGGFRVEVRGRSGHRNPSDGEVVNGRSVNTPSTRGSLKRKKFREPPVTTSSLSPLALTAVPHVSSPIL